jgi:hypothetical protein
MATDTSLIEATSQFTKLLRSGYERALFAKMVERSDRDADYAKRLSFWLKRGSTLRLRELVEPLATTGRASVLPTSLTVWTRLARIGRQHERPLQKPPERHNLPR